MADVAAMDIVIGADVGKAVTGFNLVQRELAETAVAAQKTDSSFQKMSKGTGTATNALSNLNRVVQDAPFGFIGISNNIAPLVESFTRLQKESGGTGNAFKLLLGTLSGPEGILFAVSAATSLIVAFGSKLSFSSKEAEEAAKANDELQKSLESIDKSATQTSQKEIASMQVLVRVAQDGSKAMSLRLDAVKKLQKEFPDYFGNLSKEKILYGDLTPVINQTTEALMKQAMAQAATAKAGEIGAQLLDISQKRLTAQAALNAAQAKYNTAVSDPRIGQGIVGYVKSLENAKQALGVLNDQYFELQLEQATFLGQAQNLTTTIKTNTDETKKQKAAHEDYLKTLNKEFELTNSIQAAFAKAYSGFGYIPINNLKAITTKTNEYSGALAEAIKLQKEQTKEVEDAKKAQQEGMMGSMSDILAGADDFTKRSAERRKEQFDDAVKAAQELQGVFSDVFNAMAQGGQNAIQTLLRSLEQLIIKLAAAAAAAAILAIISGGGFGAGEKSFGAIFGKLTGLGNLFKNIGKTATGGIVMNPQIRSLAEKGPEAVIPLDRLREFIQPSQSQIVVLETRVRGSDIWLSQSRTNERRNRTY